MAKRKLKAACPTGASPKRPPNETTSAQAVSGRELRLRAEAAFRESAGRSPEQLHAQAPEATRKLMHELQVHQIELEMQNDELRRTQAELELSRERYFDLYNLAPVGYCTVSATGLILEANLTAATLLGESRAVLVKLPFSRFIFKEDQDIWYLHHKRTHETGQQHACELRLVNKDGAQFWAYLTTVVAQDPASYSGPDARGEPVCRIVLSDSTERKRAEAALRKALAEVRTLRGVVPICASCKKIRDDQGFWKQVEVYVRDHTEAEFTHGICPECARKLYPWYRKNDGKVR